MQREFDAIREAIPKWDPKHYFKKFLDKFNSFTAIISGSRMSGKSNFLKYCLTQPDGGKLMSKFNMIIVFSETVGSNHFYDFLGTKLMFERYEPGILEAMKKIHDQRKSEGNRFRFLVIFDDMAVGMRYQQTLVKFFCNSRHYGGSIFFLTQKASFLGPDIKNNTTLFCILQNGSVKERNYINEDVLVDGIEPLYYKITKNIPSKSHLYRICSMTQNMLIRDYHMLVLTPFCEVKLKIFRPPLIANRRVARGQLQLKDDGASLLAQQKPEDV